MAGKHNDLQKVARDKGPLTVFVNCYAYKLNWVLKESIEPIKARKVFFPRIFTCFRKIPKSRY